MSNPDALRRFALSLAPDAAALDADPAVARACWQRFVDAGLHAPPVEEFDFAEALATLAEFSGTVGFLALQQFVANFDLGERRGAVVGVAFGHLRSADGPAPVWDGRRVSGRIPWLTGAGVFPEVILGVRGPDGEERYAIVDARDRPAFRHSATMDLVACTGTATVSVTVDGLSLSDADFFRTDPPGARARGDADGVLYQTPLLVGCVRAARDLIAARGRSTDVSDALLAEVAAAFAASNPEAGRALRARLGDHAVRITRLATMASGGGGLARSHPAQRLYREALLYNLMAQTPQIVDDAFEDVFG